MKIAIIGAMEEEVAILRDNIEDRNTVTVAGYEYSAGKMFDKDVVLVKSGIGKVNAALSATILWERFKPDYAINTGSAGGLNPQLNIGDVVISTEVTHHDVDVTAFGYEYGQVPGLPKAYPADEKLQEIAWKSAEKFSDIQIVKGLIASGDSFMSDPERVQRVAEKFENLQAVEMEAAAIAQVFYQFQVPFVIIRALSDIAGKESDVSFEEFLDTAAKNSADMVMEIIKNL